MSKLNLVLNFLVISLMAAGADAYAACTNSVSNSAPDCTGLISNSVSAVLTNTSTGIIATTDGFTLGVGIYSQATSSTNINSGTITTAGDISAGIRSEVGPSTNINSGNITTTGYLSDGILSYGGVNNNSGAITTAGEFASGIETYAHNAIANNSGTITTTGLHAFGIIHSGNSTTTNNVGSISTSGPSSYGIFILNSAGVINNYGNISTGGQNSYGIQSGPNGLINNYGTIATSADYAYGVFSDFYSADVSISNSGLISTLGFESAGIYTLGDNAQIQNSGTIHTTADNAAGISSHGNNAIITNTGSIITLGDDSPSPRISADGIASYGDAATIANSGHITTSGPNAYGIYLIGNGVAVTNTGTISASGPDSHGLYSEASNASINNTGLISTTGPNGNGIDNTGTISTVNNSGTISGIDYGVDNPGTITTLTNTGSIIGGIVSINSATSYVGITTLNNAQGGSAPLTFIGALPSNYNVIINSTSNYGKLTGIVISGAMNFGIYAGSLISSRYYSDVLQDLSDGNLGTRTGTYDAMGWTLVANGNNYDLRFSGINTVGTQASVHNSAQKLRSIFNTAAISTNFANMNTYDCNLFDANGMCISAGGLYTTVDNPSANSSSAVVVVGYKASPNIRIGGFLDQNFNNTTPTGIRIANKNPMMGAFAVWNQKEDGLGLQVKVANAYQDKDVTTTRDGVTFTAESGTGATKLNTQSYVVEFSYAAKDQYDTLVRPYLALRYTNIKQDGYTETGISTPLTYDPLTDKSTSALFGVKFNRAITAKANITASLGLELDLEHSVDQYTATSAGISGLTSENFNNDIHRTRPVASLGAYYALTKTQRISGDVYYQQLPFQSTGSTTAYFNYMIGL
jgi:hypothetical protein